MSNKIKAGWFTFTCCEDSTIIFTELLNTNWKKWREKLEFVHAKVLKKDGGGDIKPMDIAFVEGSITSDDQEKKLRMIRQKAKIIVAIGSCAVIGSPSNQRNFFSKEQLAEVKPILEKFAYKEKVCRLSDIIKVDEVVPGCPMDEKVFLNIINKYLNKANQLTT